jgi:hypothetical protein
MNKTDNTKQVRHGILLLKCLHLPKPVSQEIRPPLKRGGGDIPRIFDYSGGGYSQNLLGISPPRGSNLLGISPPFRNFAPPYKFWIFYLKSIRLQVEKICVIYLFITRRQNYIHILGFLAAGGVHSRHNHSFEVLRLVSYSTHLKWNHCPHRSHKIMLFSSGSLHSHKVAIVTLCQWRSQLDKWGGGAYSYIRIHRP